jgi:SAM-dependent methyltransferase
MPNEFAQPDFDALYRDPPALTPWDIGGPQPIVQQLVAFGGLRGEVLDPGTGPGHHAIHYASKGYVTTGIDNSPAAIERATANAARAGVSVDFQVADATKLDGLESRFDTVVDCAFYHVFFDDEETQGAYMTALHRATNVGARLYMFEFGVHNVNGVQSEFLPAENFERVLPAAGWRIDYLGPSTWVNTFGQDAFAQLARRQTNPAFVQRTKRLLEQFKTIGPLLTDDRIYVPFWSVVATRVD